MIQIIMWQRIAICSIATIILLFSPYVQALSLEDNGQLTPRQSNSSAKVGIAWPNGNDPSLKNFKTDKVGPLYTWSPDIPSQAKMLGFDPAVTMWGTKVLDDFQRKVVVGYSDTILGFNEPDNQSQSNLSPGDAAQLWKEVIEPKKHLGYRLISPATTSNPSGKTGMTNFIRACSGCTLDAHALHWYGTNPDEMIAYIEDWHNTFGKNIWVTEFACQNFSGGPQATLDQIFSFMSKVTQWMDQTDYVEAYFAFGVMHDMGNVNPDDQLMDSNGQPTALGQAYLTGTYPS